MGSFAATCGISHLGIGPGDRVKFLLLENTGDPTENIQCYSDDLWSIFAPPFDANYNDYGSIENWDPEDPNFKYAMQILRAQLVERPVGENQYHDVAVSKVAVSKTSTDKQLFQALWENRILVGGRRPPQRQVRPCIIRADVWNLLMKQSAKYGWDDGGIERWPLIFSINADISEKKLSKQQLDELVPTLSECQHFIAMLGKLRIALYPSNTIGEQCATYDAHAKWFDGLSKLANRLDKKTR